MMANFTHVLQIKSKKKYHKISIMSFWTIYEMCPGCMCKKLQSLHHDWPTSQSQDAHLENKVIWRSLMRPCWNLSHSWPKFSSSKVKRHHLLLIFPRYSPHSLTQPLRSVQKDLYPNFVKSAKFSVENNYSIRSPFGTCHDSWAVWNGDLIGSKESKQEKKKKYHEISIMTSWTVCEICPGGVNQKLPYRPLWLANISVPGY